MISKSKQERFPFSMNLITFALLIKTDEREIPQEAYPAREYSSLGFIEAEKPYILVLRFEIILISVSISKISLRVFCDRTSTELL